MSFKRLPVYAGGSSSVLTFDSYLDFPATGVVGTWYLDEANTDAYLWNEPDGVYEQQGGGGGVGDVVGPASATDNAIARFDTTTGKIIQSSVGVLTDNGTLELTPTGTGNVNALYIKGTTSQNPVIRWDKAAGDLGLQFYSGNDLIARFQDNGALQVASFATLGGMILGNWFIQRGGGPRVDFGSTDYGTAIMVGNTQAYSQAMFKVANNRATNVAMFIQGFASQSADLLQLRDSGGTVLSSFNSSGQLSYTPGDSADWTGSDPTTMKEALDRIAAALGPIA